jgi:hypothetical protein
MLYLILKQKWRQNKKQGNPDNFGLMTHLGQESNM